MKDKRTYIKHKEHGEDISHENEFVMTNDDRGPLDLERQLDDKDKIKAIMTNEFKKLDRLINLE